MIINKKHATDRHTAGRKTILADNEDEMYDDATDEYDDEFVDTLDDVADNIEDIQDSVDDIEEDDPTIDMDNNISNHFIAECESCHGIFISATIESDQEVEKVTGVCPLCEKETDQYLKWVIKDVENAEV